MNAKQKIHQATLAKMTALFHEQTSSGLVNTLWYIYITTNPSVHRNRFSGDCLQRAFIFKYHLGVDKKLSFSNPVSFKAARPVEHKLASDVFSRRICKYFIYPVSPTKNPIILKNFILLYYLFLFL